MFTIGVFLCTKFPSFRSLVPTVGPDHRSKRILSTLECWISFRLHSTHKFFSTQWVVPRASFSLLLAVGGFFSAPPVGYSKEDWDFLHILISRCCYWEKGSRVSVESTGLCRVSLTGECLASYLCFWGRFRSPCSRQRSSLLVLLS